VQVGQLYYWNDGAPIGNGITYNSNPYAHWGWNFLVDRVTYPTWGLYAALSTETYDNYTGAVTYDALRLSTNYRKLAGRNMFGWALVVNTSTYQTVCEVPVSAFPCPAMSPSPPPTPEGSSVCKYSCPHVSAAGLQNLRPQLQRPPGLCSETGCSSYSAPGGCSTAAG
jgi:hypothetical protein